ncbi:MAG TPA: Rsd/AlgQ family anti-sigma factor [Chromatiaceae bacterium]|nr:Rsd/AlgQ family anti-sigma factor [Chromatiaceae bacterium]HIB85305.1 Rsd/AlgQ family anti-sigma factor [Chromatiaceae bacterium]HIN83257.1 Rsd/AlgQ family anti-sigma factor [Chromatiales bacterium]HIO14584.1 Rsd/AlgQ family anti-sigma factor [Chromatiales bacterium]HIO55374.1 Rsd/AlgQ family anti-sigma factor [Chromatiales bacterium]
MGTHTQDSRERRSQTQELIGHLVTERQQMLVQYAGLAGLDPYTENKPVFTRLQDFCQILVDYMASGHFGLYQRISDGKERRRAVIDIAEKLYPKIAKTTEDAVAFNDYFDTPSDTKRINDLSHHLSQLGETLATRIELEDRLITTLLA